MTDDLARAVTTATPMQQTLADDIGLIEALRFVVPFWIAEARRLTPNVRLTYATRCAEKVGSMSDAMLFRRQYPTQKRNAITAFNALAEGIAYGAFLTGGIQFASYHWCISNGHMCVQLDTTCDADAVTESQLSSAPRATGSLRPVNKTATVRGGVL